MFLAALEPHALKRYMMHAERWSCFVVADARIAAVGLLMSYLPHALSVVPRVVIRSEKATEFLRRHGVYQGGEETEGEEVESVHF